MLLWRKDLNAYRTIVKTVLGVGLCAFVLVSTEVALRLWYRYPHALRCFVATKERVGYGLQPSTVFKYIDRGRLLDVSIDPSGRRRTGSTSGLRSDAITVDVIGDSQVFGWRLSDSETIPAKLQNKLGSGWRVLNWGVPGYGPYQYARKLSDVPEGHVAIVIQTETNDLEDSYLDHPPLYSRCGFLVARSALGRLLPCCILASDEFALAIDLEMWLRDSRLSVPLGFNPNARVAARVLSYRIQALYDAATVNRNLTVLYVVVPWDAALLPNRLRNYRPVISNAAQFVRLPGGNDLFDEMRSSSDPQDLFQFDFHLSAAGAEFVAGILAQKLRDLEKVRDHTTR